MSQMEAGTAVPYMGERLEWKAEIVNFRFTFGHRRWSMPLKSLLLENHFTTFSGLPDEVRPPFEQAPPDVQAIVMRSFPTETAPPRQSRLRDAYRYVPKTYPRYYTRLEGTFEEYLDKFSSKTRSTLKRKVKKFASLSGDTIDFREYRTPNELDEFHTHAIVLSRLTYQDRLLDAGLPDTPEFIEGMRKAAKNDNARGYLLMKDGRAIAYLYCPIEDGIVLYAYLGYDPAYAALSSGTVLQYLAFERLFQEPHLRIFDFTEGEGEHKKLYATDHVQCADFYYFRPTLRNAAVIQLHSSTLSFTRFISRTLQQTGLKSRLKRFLRRG